MMLLFFLFRFSPANFDEENGDNESFDASSLLLLRKMDDFELCLAKETSVSAGWCSSSFLLLIVPPNAHIVDRIRLLATAKSASDGPVDIGLINVPLFSLKLPNRLTLTLDFVSDARNHGNRKVHPSNAGDNI
jgi:hypothetical protein